MDLHRGGDKRKGSSFQVKGARRSFGELRDYSTVSCWTLSWAGRLMRAKTGNALQHQTKVKHFLCLSLCLSPPVRGRFVQEKVRWNVKSRVIALERELLINALSCLFSYRLPIWIFHLILLASPLRTQLYSQSQQKDRRIQCMQRSKNKQFGYEWQTVSRGWDRQQTNPCRAKSKAQASAEKLTTTSGLSLKK